jgi:hypothetical protein
MAGYSTAESARDAEFDDSSVRSLSGVSARLMEIDLPAAEEQLRAEDAWRRSGRNAVTLVKYPDLRLVLEVMRPGPRIDETHAAHAGRVVVQVLSGCLRLKVDGHALDVPAGRLIALDHRVPEAIEALDESSFLLWVSWPDHAA